jgi:hypothetical protein
MRMKCTIRSFWSPSLLSRATRVAGCGKRLKGCKVERLPLTFILALAFESGALLTSLTGMPSPYQPFSARLEKFLNVMYARCNCGWVCNHSVAGADFFCVSASVPCRRLLPNLNRKCPLKDLWSESDGLASGRTKERRKATISAKGMPSENLLVG